MIPDFDLRSLSDIDPDSIYHSASVTFFYFPKSEELYTAKYPNTHKDMLRDNDKIYQQVYHKAESPPEKESLYNSRGFALAAPAAQANEALLGRIGIHGKVFVVAFWNKHLTKKFLAGFFAKLFEQYPQFKALQDKIVITWEGTKSAKYPGVVWLTDKESEVSLQPQRAVKLAPKKFKIDGVDYTLEDLQRMRSMVHSAGVTNPVLCHPDLQKYPELQGFRPVDCDKSISGPAFNHPAAVRTRGRAAGNPYANSYGECTFSQWVLFDDAFQK